MGTEDQEPRNPTLAANMRRLMDGRSIEVIRKAMAEAGFAIGSGSLHRAQKGESGSRLETLEKIAAFFGIAPDQLLQPDLGARAELVTRDGSTFLPGFEHISISKLANTASMGGGAEQLPDDVVVGRLTLSPQWIAKTIKPLTKLDNLRFIHGYGDSMEPTFSDGDILLVDGGVRDCDVDGIYVLEANDRLFVKRVTERFDGAHEITSDNPKVKTMQLLDGTQDVRVLGRVVWAWNGKKL